MEPKKNLLNRLHRIEGQIRGVQTMVEGERACAEVLQQLAAIRSAVSGAMQITLKEYAQECLLNLDEKDQGQREQFIQNLIHLLGVVDP